MSTLDQTVRFTGDLGLLAVTDRCYISLFDATNSCRTIDLNAFGKSVVTFGRGSENDLVLTSPLVSQHHGRFVCQDNRWLIEERSVYTHQASTNGLLYHKTAFLTKKLSPGDVIRIDDAVQTSLDGVLFLYGGATSDVWSVVDLDSQEKLSIGRDRINDICLPHLSVSKHHAEITRQSTGYVLVDTSSTNGILVNHERVTGQYLLQEKDLIVITNATLIFSQGKLYYCYAKEGISVDARQVVIKRGKGKKSFVTGNDISLSINPGDFVAIVGGSGAGKSTLLNALSGYLRPDGGQVFINGVDLYQNFEVLKDIIGYVPQSDIVYDNLSLYDMLDYTARLRLPKDVSELERKEAIEQAIKLVELTDKKDASIKSFSGGQKKRASIAVELLSDPNLLFLDEPSSGLDPWTERQLMESLKVMAANGKTVVLVTHSTLQLQMCDKIIFMGKGGNLCFSGSYEEALAFFGVSDLVDIYQEITERAPFWKKEFNRMKRLPSTEISKGNLPSTRKKSRFQLGVLSARYAKLVWNDKQRLLLLLAQAPLLTALIALVSNGEQFDQYEMTKSLLFALSCSAFWMGMLNAIQEICKERIILRREYMAGQSLTAYLLSKLSVLGIICALQGVLSVLTFSLLVGLPDKGVFLPPIIEVFLTTVLTALSASAMGLLVSSLFKNPDRAMTVAPLLLMPQILFSGLIFKLDGLTEMLSFLALCRFSMEAYGTTANLNQLQLRLQQDGVPIPHESEYFFEFTREHLVHSWSVLAGFAIVFMVLARLSLHQIQSDS